MKIYYKGRIEPIEVNLSEAESKEMFLVISNTNRNEGRRIKIENSNLMVLIAVDEIQHIE